MTGRQSLRNAFPKLAVTMCFMGPSIMALSDILTVILNNHDNPIDQTISGFAISPYGWLEKIGMAMVAVSFLFIGLGLLMMRGKKEFRMLKLGSVLFIIVGLAFLMTSLFNADVNASVSSFHGLIHRLSLIVSSAAFYPSCVFIMRLMIKRPDLKYFGIYSGVTCLVGFAVLVWLIFSYRHIEYMGLLERMVAAVTLLWIGLVGPRVIKLANALATEDQQTDSVPVGDNYNRYPSV